jgi:hypothetical protein
MLCALLCAQYAVAQTVTGVISGTVMDASGNALAGAAVRLINERTNDARVLTTNESGDFRFTAVLPGTYTIKVEQKGFSSFERRGNVLTANEHLAVGELAMKVGELSETVTTVAEGTPVQTESTELSALLSSKQLELISQRGRDVTTLLKILPGVAYGGESETAGSGFGSGIPQIQGGRNTQSTFNVDGARGNDLGSPSTFSSTVNFDAIEGHPLLRDAALQAARQRDNKVVKAVFDDWQLSGITAFASGTPSGVSFTTTKSFDIIGGGDGSRLVMLGDPTLDNSDRKPVTLSNGLIGPPQWIIAAALALPAKGDFGDAPKSVFRLPGTNNWDISLFKKIPLKSETRYLQFQ